MKFFKYAKVDSVTRVSVRKVPTTNGPSHPFTELAGLDVKWGRDRWHYGTANDAGAVADDLNHRFELTATEWNDAIQVELAIRKVKYIEQLHTIDKRKRDTQLQNYHFSDLATGFSRVPEAQAAQAASTEVAAKAAAPLLTIEAGIRVMTTKALAALVIAESNALLLMDCHLAGTKALKIDTINAVTFDVLNPLSALEDLDSQIDSGDVNDAGDPIMVPKYDVNAGWPDLTAL